MKKRGQHHVWEYYLKSWSSKGKIYCLGDGKIFKTNPKNVAKKRDFYRLKELSENDIELIKKLAIEKCPQHLQKIHLEWINQFNFIFNFKKELDSLGLPQEIDAEIDKFINNFQEDIHSQIEDRSIKFIDSILRRDIEFFKTDIGNINFTYFLCQQYLRTQNIKSRVLSNTQRSKYDIEKIWNVLSHIFATNMAATLSNTRQNLRMVLIINESSIPFITGDQPVVNTYAVDKFGNELVDDFELYYPVSSKLAILITQKAEYLDIDRLFVEDKDVELFNSYIIKSSHEQIYSNSKEILERYKKEPHFSL